MPGCIGRSIPLAAAQTVGNSLGNPLSLSQQWQVINQTKWIASASLRARTIFRYGQFKAR